MAQYNFITKVAYKGKNVTILSEAKAENGFTKNEWLTFVQGKKAGMMLKKGSKGTTLVKYVKIDKKDEAEEIKAIDAFGRKRATTKPYYFTVFNIEQFKD